jgi:hypothetical protein
MRARMTGLVKGKSRAGLIRVRVPAKLSDVNQQANL